MPHAVLSLTRTGSTASGVNHDQTLFSVSNSLFVCCAFQGGIYLLQLLDHHVCSGTTLLLLSFCESISIGWVYGKSQNLEKTNNQNFSKLTFCLTVFLPEGADRFYNDISNMIGYRPHVFMKYSWKYITPFVCFVSYLISLLLSPSSQFAVSLFKHLILMKTWNLITKNASTFICVM